MFKYKEKTAFTYNIQSVVWNAEGGKIHLHSTLYLLVSKQQSTQTGCYTIAACFPFEAIEK